MDIILKRLSSYVWIVLIGFLLPIVSHLVKTEADGIWIVHQYD